MEPQDIDWTKILTVAGVVAVFALGAGLLLLGWVILRVRRIHLPPDADWITALHATPLIVVIVLDLLDFALDFLAAPIGWVLLTRLGLGPLRPITLVEALLPFTRLIPVMTAAWCAVRILHLQGTALPQR